MTKSEIENKIASLNKGIKSVATPANMKIKMQEQVTKLEGELKNIKEEPTNVEPKDEPKEVKKNLKDFKSFSDSELKEEISKLKSKQKKLSKSDKEYAVSVMDIQVLEMELKDRMKKVPKVEKKVVTKVASKKTETKPAKSKGEPEISCEELLEKYNKRKKSHDKAEKKYATTSISEKMGNNIASAISKAMDNVSAEELKKSPKKYIAQFEGIKKEVKSFIGKLKPLLGKDFDKDELFAPLEDVITEHIENIRKKQK